MEEKIIMKNMYQIKTTNQLDNHKLSSFFKDKDSVSTCPSYIAVQVPSKDFDSIESLLEGLKSLDRVGNISIESCANAPSYIISGEEILEASVVEFTARPYAVSKGSILVPKNTADVKDYIDSNWAAVDLDEPYLDFSDTDIEIDDEYER